jgi:hypothetical protein
MDITAEVIADFRIWPLGGQAFSSTTDFPDNLIQYALCEADTETGSKRWGTYQADCRNLKQRGLFYYAAHWLAVYYPEGLNSDVNQEARLNVATKSVGDESISYRVPAMMEVSDDWLTWSTYGQQFYRLRKRVGIGVRGRAKDCSVHTDAIV